jgi:4-amino-4-deoxy-L-arabinose transferase-like glycosyltransferase
MAVVALAPMFVLIAALGTRTGLWSPELGYDLLAMRVGVGLAVFAAVAALLLLIQALRARAPVWLAVVAIVVAAATLGVYGWQISRILSGPPDDISTDMDEVPGFGALDARRGGVGPVPTAGVESCPGAVPAMTQVAPESAVWALQEAGFSLQGGVSVSRAAGTHRGFWFGTVHDAVIRIRPGRTDVRVAARDGRPHGGEACRLATRISQLLRGED